MYQKLILIQVCVLLFLLPGVVFAHDKGPYVSGKIMAVFVSDADNEFDDPALGAFKTEYEPDFGLEGAVGYDFGYVRLEGEAGYRRNDLEKTDGIDVSGAKISAWSFLLNASLDIENDSPVVPYLGAGIGAANVDADGPINDNDTVLAYQGTAGLGFALNKAVVLDLGYRFFATADPEFGGGGGKLTSEFESHNVFVGFRYRFQR